MIFPMYSMSKPVEVRFRDAARLIEIDEWSQSRNMTIDIHYDRAQKVFFVTHRLSTGLELQRFFSILHTAVRTKAGMSSAASFAQIMNYRPLRIYRSMPDFVEWALGEMCKAGVLRLREDRDKRTRGERRTINKYSVVSNYLPL